MTGESLSFFLYKNGKLLVQEEYQGYRFDCNY